MSGYLIHYSSPYYDPVKAHEYYEAHKKLKGRRSTSGLNESGRQAAQYVKSQLTEEKKRRIAASKSERDAKINANNTNTSAQLKSKKAETKQQIEAYSNRANAQIDSLREKLKRMSPAQKAANKDHIQSMIDKLRKNNSAQRERLNAAYSAEANTLRENKKTNNESYRETHKKNVKAINDYYTAQYENELDKMKADKAFTSKTKKRS